MSRPSDGMTPDQLRDEFDWYSEFMACLADHIRNDPDVHSLADYVKKLEDENAKLRNELAQWERLTASIELPEYPVTQFEPKDLERENAKLRELVRDMINCFRIGAQSGEGIDRQWCYELHDSYAAQLHELGIEVG